MSKTFRGELISFGLSVYPENSVFEGLERRRIAGEEAVQSIARQKMLARKFGKQGQAAKEKKTKNVRRNSRLNASFLEWKKKSGNSRRPPEHFREEILNGLWRLPERLRRQLTRNGKFMSKRQLRNILLVRPRPDRG